MKRARWLIMALGIGWLATGSSLAYPPPRSTEDAFQVRIGGFFPSGGGELWDTNEAVFTLDRSDFNAAALGISYVHAVTNHLEVGFNGDFYDKTVLSAYRGFVDQDGFPILHDTQLSTAAMTADLRLVPGGRHRIRGPRGRQVLKPVFYVGAGIGVNFWEYEEVGDFLDFTNDPPDVFFDRFQETGAAFEAHVLAGLELPLAERVNLLFEGRYSSSDDEFDEDFAGLGKLELGGGSAYVGLAFRF